MSTGAKSRGSIRSDHVLLTSFLALAHCTSAHNVYLYAPVTAQLQFLVAII